MILLFLRNDYTEFRHLRIIFSSVDYSAVLFFQSDRENGTTEKL